jgi:riboflavin biosynthesis pyrimidine reductase
MTIPRRITLGFLLLVLLSLLIGGLSLWQLLGLKQNVIVLADNSVPSVVTLNEIIKANAETAKQVRQIVRIAETDSAAVVSDAAFRAAVDKGSELSSGYSKLFSDKEDERLFTEAFTARTQYLATAAKVIEMATSGKAKEARELMTTDLDSQLDRTIKGFDDDITYNIKLANDEGVKAKANAGVASLLIEGGGTLAASFVKAGLVDRIEWFRAPILLGSDGRAALGELHLAQLAAAPRYERVGVKEVGVDLWESYRRKA